MSEHDDDDNDNIYNMQSLSKRYNTNTKAPPLPCKKAMSKEDYVMAQKEHKTVLDTERYKKIKAAKDIVSNFYPISQVTVPPNFVLQLLLYSIVCWKTFPTKVILWLCIKEEANLQCLYITTYPNDERYLVVFMDSFFLLELCLFTVKDGW